MSTLETGCPERPAQGIATIRHTTGIPATSAIRFPNFRDPVGGPGVSVVPEFSEGSDEVVLVLAGISVLVGMFAGMLVLAPVSCMRSNV